MAEDPDSRKPIQRRWLSIFFIVHWWAVAAYVVPSTRAGIEPLPDWLEPAVALVAPRAVRWTSPLTVPYQDLSAVRQHWTLFAPWPASWSQSLKVVPYFPAGDRDGWVADTLTLRGPREQDHPHVLNHRTHRILFNMGYEQWGSVYRPYFAAEMCRTLTDQNGRGPEGVELYGVWYLEWAPWADPTEEERAPYLQRLGGFDCDEEVRGGAGLWWAYGLPDPVNTTGWQRVPWPPPEGLGSEAEARPGDAEAPDSLSTPEGEIVH